MDLERKSDVISSVKSESLQEENRGTGLKLNNG